MQAARAASQAGSRAPSRAGSQRASLADAAEQLSGSQKFVLCPKRIHKLRQGLRAELVKENPDYEVCWRCDHCNLYVEGPDFVINPWHCECGYDLCNRCYEHFLNKEQGVARAQTQTEETEDDSRK